MYGTGSEQAIKITRALLRVGAAVEEEYREENSRKYGIPRPPSFAQGGTVPTTNSFFHPLSYEILLARRKAARQELDAAESLRAPWSQGIKLKVGSFLVNALMEAATVTRYAAVDRKQVYVQICFILLLFGFEIFY